MHKLLFFYIFSPLVLISALRIIPNHLHFFYFSILSRVASLWLSGTMIIGINRPYPSFNTYFQTYCIAISSIFINKHLQFTLPLHIQQFFYLLFCSLLSFNLAHFPIKFSFPSLSTSPIDIINNRKDIPPSWSQSSFRLEVLTCLSFPHIIHVL